MALSRRHSLQSGTADGEGTTLHRRAGDRALLPHVHDIVKYAKAQGILCQGRGSAANSAICYVLGVTAVDPNAFDVLFERFLQRRTARAARHRRGFRA